MRLLYTKKHVCLPFDPNLWKTRVKNLNNTLCSLKALARLGHSELRNDLDHENASFSLPVLFACMSGRGDALHWRDGQNSSELESDDWHVLLEAHFGATILHTHTHTRTSILAITSQCSWTDCTNTHYWEIQSDREKLKLTRDFVLKQVNLNTPPSILILQAA